MHTDPQRISTNNTPRDITYELGKCPIDWTVEVWHQWQKNVAWRFSDDEWCSNANHFTPRPYVNQYDGGSSFEGFCYTVQPGNRVCVEQWRKVAQ